MLEYLDILNDKGEKTGVSVPYDEAHEKGLIHLAAQVWILNSQGQLLLQKRSANKRAYPNLWDISAAGHVSSGETSVEGAMKEVREELGLKLEESELKLLFSLEQHVVLNNGTYINNEFNDVYLVNKDVDVGDIKMQKEEVSEVKWMSVAEIKTLIENNPESIVPHEEEYQKLFAYLEKVK